MKHEEVQLKRTFSDVWQSRSSQEQSRYASAARITQLLGSAYNWNNQKFDSIVQELIEESNCESSECTLITSDRNLEHYDVIRLL